MRVKPLMVAVFVMIAGAAQAAARWSASFGAQAVASYLPERDRKPSVMVVAAGSGGEAGAAASALIDALRAGGRVRAAIDGAALGDVEPLSDEQIVKRAASQPVGLIAIVRVFPGSEGHGEMAVVTFYGRDGKAAGAFSVERGAPLQPAASPTEVLGGLGVSAATGPGSGARSRRATRAITFFMGSPDVERSQPWVNSSITRTSQ